MCYFSDPKLSDLMLAQMLCPDTKKGFEIKKVFVGILHQKGAKLLLGTDDWFSGFSIHVELQELV